MPTDRPAVMRDAPGRFSVWLGGRRIGMVWREDHTEVRWNPGGKTTNQVHPSKTVRYWRCTRGTEYHPTRRDAVAELVEAHRAD